MKKTAAPMAGQMSLFEMFVGVPISPNTEEEAPVKKACSKKKESLSPIHKFIKEYDGYTIEDACTVASEDFKSYCKKLRSALSKEAKLHGMEVTLKPNHYDMSGFFKKGDKFAYWSFYVMRGDMPTYLNDEDKYGCEKFLYRTAKSEKDFTGGRNNYCTLSELVDNVDRLIA